MARRPDMQRFRNLENGLNSRTSPARELDAKSARSRGRTSRSRPEGSRTGMAAEIRQAESRVRGSTSEGQESSPLGTPASTPCGLAEMRSVPEIDSHEKTIVLFAKSQSGNRAASEELYRRLIPRLERFAHGRIQSALRSVTDTQEIVQDTLVRSLPRLSRFKPR